MPLNIKIKDYDWVALIGAIGMIWWLSTSFYGGMVIHLLGYPYLVLPIFFAYVISILEVMVHVGRKRISQIKIISHLLVLLGIISLSIYNSELLKAEIMISARLNDDLSAFRLILREDNSFENHVYGIFGLHEVFKGDFVIRDDTLIFFDPPYDNDFFPDTLLIIPEDSAIYIERNPNGTFRTEKEWLNHYKIE